MRPTLLALVLSVIASLPSALTAQAIPPAVARGPEASAGHRKSPVVAHVLGIVPGLGHAYAGEGRRGLAFVGGIIGVTMLTSVVLVGDCVTDLSSDELCETGPAETVGSIAILALWGWSIVDAGLAARRTNVQRGQVTPTVALTRLPTATGHQERAVKVGLRFRVR